MTTHQLARVLLALEEMPAMTLDEDGLYCELSTIIPATLYRREPFTRVEFNVPVTREQKDASFKVFLIT